MGRSINTSARAAFHASQQANLDKASQPTPENPADAHRAREVQLLERVDVGTGERAHIDRISTGAFIERIMELASEWGLPGGGDFVDLGSGTVTANVVSFVSLVWPRRFEAIHAVDLAQDMGTMASIQNMRRRVGGVHANVSYGMLCDAMENTGNIVWWTVTDELQPSMLFMPFMRAAAQSRYTSVLFARASFIYSCDLLFADAAIDAYRREIARSLVDTHSLLYVTCREVGGRRMRTASEDEWVYFGGKGTDDSYIGPYIQRVCKVTARGGIDVAWQDTVFYLVIIQGPFINPDGKLAEEVLDSGDPSIKAIAVATSASIREAYREVDKQTKLLDATATSTLSASASALPSLEYGELTEASMSKLIRLLGADTNDVNVSIDSRSRILDVGSGFGKAVINFALSVPFCMSFTGIETMRHRHVASIGVLETLRARSTAWHMRLENVFMIHGDAGSTGFDYSTYSHIFMYDYVFDEQTHRDIFARIAKDATFTAFICFCNMDKLRARGWPLDQVPLKLIFSERLTTTGKQRFTCYVYSRGDDS